MMKKWKRLLALSLAAVLCLTGCAGGQTAQNEADKGGLPLAEWTDEPVIAQVVVNSGFSRQYIDGLQVSQLDSYWRLFEQWDNGELVGVGPLGNLQNNLPPWASLQHEAYIFAQTESDPAYVVDEQYIYWLEVPAPYNVEGDHWYLYVRAVSQDGAQGEPVCIAEGNYAVTSKDVSENGIPYDWEARDGKVLWAQPENGEIVIKLYEAANGALKELARFPADSAEVALSLECAVWTEVGDTRTLKCCDLTSNEITDITPDAEVAAPMIVGDHLIVMDGVVDGQSGAPQLLVYDLADGEWAYRISSDLPPLENMNGFARPQVIDDAHIALVAVGEDAYQLPVVYLETGEVHALEKVPTEPFYFYTGDNVETLKKESGFVAYHIQPPSRNGENPVSTWQDYDDDGRWEEIVYSVEFHW